MGHAEIRGHRSFWFEFLAARPVEAALCFALRRAQLARQKGVLGCGLCFGALCADLRIWADVRLNSS